MVAEVFGIVGLVIVALDYLEKLAWGQEHALRLAYWVLSHEKEARPVRYTHNPVRDYRVSGPESKV